MAGHIFNIFSHVGLFPSWMQRYCPLPGKTNPNVKEIAKRWDLYPKSGDVSVPQLRSILEAVRKGAEEALSKTLDDNDLEQAICKVVWQIHSNGKVLPYVSWWLRSNLSFSSTKIRLRLKFTLHTELKQQLCINQVCFRIGHPFFQILLLRIVKVNYLLIFFVHQCAPPFTPRLKSLKRTQTCLDCSTNVSIQ